MKKFKLLWIMYALILVVTVMSASATNGTLDINLVNLMENQSYHNFSFAFNNNTYIFLRSTALATSSSTFQTSVINSVNIPEMSTGIYVDYVSFEVQYDDTSQTTAGEYYYRFDYADSTFAVSPTWKNNVNVYVPVVALNPNPDKPITSMSIYYRSLNGHSFRVRNQQVIYSITNNNNPYVNRINSTYKDTNLYSTSSLSYVVVKEYDLNDTFIKNVVLDLKSSSNLGYSTVRLLINDEFYTTARSIRGSDNGGGTVLFDLPFININNIKVELLSSSSSYSARVSNIEFFEYDFSTNYNGSILPLTFATGNYELYILFNDYIYSQNISLNSSELTNITLFISDALLNINLNNAWTNNAINDFSGWISNDDYNFNYSFSTFNGLVSLGLKKDLDYTVFVESPEYVPSGTQNIFLNNINNDLVFNQYTLNSIRVFVRDEETGDLITENVSVLVNNNDFYQETFSTTSGSLLLENLTDNIYTLRFNSSSYEARSYSVSVTEKSTQELTAYLSNSISTVTFNILDFVSASTIEGARISMSRYLNGAFVTVESKLSDITGKVVLTYSPDTRYKFVVGKDGYSSRTFELNPILLNEYNVRLEQSQSFPDIPQLFTVSVDYLPKYFYQGENNVTLFFNSPEGRFSLYGFTITYPGGEYSFDNTNAVGETKTIEINIIGAEFLDTVDLTYYYRVVGGEIKSYTVRLPIRDVVTQYTIVDNIRNQYDLTAFEKLIIMTLTIILVGGIAILTAGAQVGGVVVLMLFGLFSFMGFVPVWSIAIVLIVGLTYVIGDKI